jgi:hypothetical protein
LQHFIVLKGRCVTQHLEWIANEHVQPAVTGVGHAKDAS